MCVCLRCLLFDMFDDAHKVGGHLDLCARGEGGMRNLWVYFCSHVQCNGMRYLLFDEAYM